MTSPSKKPVHSAKALPRQRWRRVILLGVVAVLLVAAGTGAFFARREFIHRKFLAMRDKAIAACKAGDYAGALDDLVKYYGRYKTDPDALYYLAEARRHVELPDGSHLVAAASLYARLLELQPNRTDVRREMMLLYSRVGYANEALNAADRVLRDKEDDPQALAVKAKAKFRLREFKEALDLAQRAVRLDSLDVETQALLLQLYRQLNSSEKILPHAQVLLSMHPNDGRAELVMSFACMLVDSFSPEQQKAMQDLLASMYPDFKPNAITAYGTAVFFIRKAASRPVEELDYVRMLAGQLERMRLPGDCAAVLQRALEKKDDLLLRRWLVRRLYEMGRVADAETALNKLQLKPIADDADMLAIKALCASGEGKQAEADAIADSLVAAAETQRYARAWGAVLKQVLSAKASEPLKIIEAGQSASDAQRVSPYLRYYVGEAYAIVGEGDLAVESLQQVVQACPLWTLPLVRLSQLYYLEGQRSAAVAVALRAADVSASPPVIANLATVVGIDNVVKEKDQRLLKSIQAIQEKAPGEPQTLPLHIAILARMGKQAEAKTALLAALQPPPATTRPAAPREMRQAMLLRLAAVSREAGLGLETECLAAAEKEFGLTPDLAMARAMDLLNSGRPAEGAKLLRDAMPQKPGDADVVWKVNLARYLELAKDPSAAKAWIALADDPANRSNLAIQRSAMSASSVQSDAQFVSRTIDRVRQITGEQAAGWKLARTRLLLRSGSPADSAEAATLAGQLVAAMPNQAEPHLLLAAAQERAKNAAAAIEQLNLAIKLRPDSARLNLNVARLYQGQNDLSHVREALDRIRPDQLDAADPKSFDERREYARLCMALGDNVKAAAILEKDPAAATQPVEGLMLAATYFRRNQIEQADGVYAGLLKEPTPQIVLTAASYYSATHRPAEAEKALKLLDTLKLDDAERNTLLASYDATVGNIGSAIKRYGSTTQAAPANIAAWRGLLAQLIRPESLADAKTRDQRITQALATADAAAKAIAPARSRALDNFRNNAALMKAMAAESGAVPLLNVIALSDSDSDTALQAVKIVMDGRKSKRPAGVIAVELQPVADRVPALVPVQLLLIAQCLGAERMEDAAAVAQRTLKAAPASVETAQLATQVFILAKDWTQALAAANQWRELTLRQPQAADLGIAEVELLSGDVASAAKQIQPYLDAARANPDSAPGVLLLDARILIQQGQVNQAADLLAPTLSLSRSWRQAWAELAWQMRGKPATAAAWLDRLAAATPQDAIDELRAVAQLWYRLGKAANAPQYVEKSRALLTQLIQRNPNLAAAIFDLAFLNAQEGRSDDAEKGYRKVLELQPDLAAAQNNLAMIVADRNGDLAEALALAKKATAASANPSYFDTLAFVQAKLKDFDGAIISQKKAIDLDPANFDWRLNLARICQQAGRTAEALKLVNELEVSIKDARNVSSKFRTDLVKLRMDIGAGPSSRTGG